MVEAEVEVVSTQLVHARSCKKQRIELAPSDLMSFLIPPIHHGLLFLKPPSGSYVERLKKSLSCVLDSFFLLAGRLVMVEEDSVSEHERMVSFFIDCSNQGAQFVHATANHVTVADILDPVSVPPVLHSFFPLNKTRGYAAISEPLLAVQVTELVDGVFIGCYMNHFVVDATSFWNFINSWSEISRHGPYQDSNNNIISKPPISDRSLIGTLCSINFPIRVPFPLTGNELEPPPPAAAGLESRVFHFSKTKIAELKARTKCRGDANDNKISSLQSLLAHVWRFMLQIEGANLEDGTLLMFAIGTRSRFQVPLGDEYFGNAVDCELVNLTVKEVVDGAAAPQINRVVAAHTPDKVRRKVESWIQNPTILGAGGKLPPNTFIVANSPRFNVYGNDFGWGNPVAARINPCNSPDGFWSLFPGEEEGSIDIEICSSSLSLAILGNDPRFT